MIKLKDPNVSGYTSTPICDIYLLQLIARVCVQLRDGGESVSVAVVNKRLHCSTFEAQFEHVTACLLGGCFEFLHLLRLTCLWDFIPGASAQRVNCWWGKHAW